MDLRYPIGKFDWSATVDPAMRPQWMAEIAGAGQRYRDAVRGLEPEQLDTPYRPGGWTVRQVIHHVPDSHMNCFIRFRLALTEDEPTIKPYDEARWAELADSRTAPVEVSLQLLESLHSRWVSMMEGMSDSDFARTFRHPEVGVLRLDTTLAGYAWHCRHHAAHITGLRERMGWK
jgi:DinB superfamily